MTQEEIAAAVKTAVAQLEAEKVAAAQAEANEESDAFELGLRAFAKDAGLRDDADVQDFLGLAAGIATQGQ